MNNILSKIIKHASENVPFYRELYSKMGHFRLHA